MRMTVEEFIEELMKCDPKAAVNFQTANGNNGPLLRNHVARVDNFGHTINVVIESGV